MDQSGGSSADSTPTLRWVFVRAAERIQCELSLDSTGLVYQFRARRLEPRSSETIEQFMDVVAAFQRQSEFEASLVRDGWSLHQYGKSNGSSDA